MIAEMLTEEVDIECSYVGVCAAPAKLGNQRRFSAAVVFLAGE